MKRMNLSPTMSQNELNALKSQYEVFYDEADDIDYIMVEESQDEAYLFDNDMFADVDNF